MAAAIQPAAMETIEVEDPVAKKLTSVKTAKPNAQMYFSIGIAMVGAMMFGLDQGNFGSVQSFNSFQEHWCYDKYGDKTTCTAPGVDENHEWNEDFILWTATLITVGAAVGALTLAPIITRKLGRRPTIGIGGFICFLGCLLASYLAFDTVWIFYVGRFITGFGVGVASFVLPLYNAECSTPTLRGMTGSLFQLNVAVGGVIATMICRAISDWALGMFLPGIAGGVLAVASFFIPESPRYVMEQQGYDAGKAMLKRIRRGNVEVEANEIWTAIQEEANVDHVSYAGICADGNLCKRVIIACGLVVAQQLTGVNAFLSYATTIFSKCGFDDPILMSIYFTWFMVVFCAIGLALIDSPYGGRRGQLLVATCMMGPPLIIAATALTLNWNVYIVLIMVCLYGGGFQFAWGIVPWIYPAEIFSMAEKETAVSLAVFLNYVSNGVIVYVTPFMMGWSTPGTFYLFAALNVGCALFVLGYVKETKGIPLDETPALFKSRREKNAESKEVP